jgi:hypothetical protein
MFTCLLILVMGTLVMVCPLPIFVRLLSLSLFIPTRSTPSPHSTCPLETESTDIESWGLHYRPPPSLIVCVTELRLRLRLCPCRSDLASLGLR